MKVYEGSLTEWNIAYRACRDADLHRSARVNGERTAELASVALLSQLEAGEA